MQKTLFISKPLKQSAEKRLKQKRGPRGGVLPEEEIEKKQQKRAKEHL
jgi:hypothetical protein